MPRPSTPTSTWSSRTGTPGRHYWQHTREFWRDDYHGRRAKRFYQALEEAYQAVPEEPAPTTPALATAEVGNPARRPWSVAFAVAGVAVTAIVVRALRRIVRHR